MYVPQEASGYTDGYSIWHNKNLVDDPIVCDGFGRAVRDTIVLTFITPRLFNILVDMTAVIRGATR